MSNSPGAYGSALHNIRHVSRIRLFIRALGVCFFSVLSVLLAFYAFIEMPQVQDLLFDARPHWSQEIIYWAGVYAIGIFIWVLPLVFTARLLLLQNFDVIGIDTEERFNFYIFRLPSFFVVLAFIAVFIGIVAASDNLPVPLTDGGNPYEGRLHSLLVSHLIILLIATGLVLILVIVRELFIRGYGRSMESLEKRNPEKFKRTLIRIERLTRKPYEGLENLDLHLTALKPGFLSTETWIAAQRVKEFMWRYMSRITLLIAVLVAIHFLSYSDLVRDLFSLPHSLAYSGLQGTLDFIADTLYIKRASFLFVIFGAWLPFAALLAALSNRYQFPFITALIVVVVGLTLFMGDGHDVRIEKIAENAQKDLKPIAFADAVKAWKGASGWNAKGCEQLSNGAAELVACPRPIVVAGEGGGSRAAFLLASVLGALEDESLNKQKHPTARPFHQQLFAISSVSGSSVGAAFFVSALKVHPSVPVDRLKQSLFRQRLWFPNVANASSGQGRTSFLTDFVTYKDALQAALSNDFISPTAIAYLARDLLTLSRFPFVYDRAGILERSWEDAFDDVYGISRRTSPLSAPLLTRSPSAEAWEPLLFFNSTSMETGRRIIVTPVKITEPVDGEPLINDSYDLHQLLCSPYEDPVTHRYPELSPLDRVARLLPSLFSPVANAKCAGTKPVSIDVRLSTAASLSSRSPLITPHAGIRDRRAQIADSAVDGGYFDNSGGVTAIEIAERLKGIDSRLQPFILQISSEPDWFKDTQNCMLGRNTDTGPAVPDQADFYPTGTIGDIFTVNAARIARGYETIVRLPKVAAKLNGGLRSAAQINICPQRRESFFFEQIAQYTTSDKAVEAEKRAMRIMRKARRQTQSKTIALSWWLSPPLQAFLDGEIYSKHNLAERDCVLSLLEDRKPGDPGGCQ